MTLSFSAFTLAADKLRIEKEADLPRFTYALTEPLETIVKDKALFAKLDEAAFAYRDITNDEILAEFRAAGALLEGHFILSSGLRSPRYLQCARVLMNPLRASRLAIAMVQKLPRELRSQIDKVVSPAMGGVIFTSSDRSDLSQTDLVSLLLTGRTAATAASQSGAVVAEELASSLGGALQKGVGDAFSAPSFVFAGPMSRRTTARHTASSHEP